MTESEAHLLILLEEAQQLAARFTGGYSGEFFGAGEFHTALKESISKYRDGDKSQLNKLHTWFAPTSCWDDFIGREGQDMANEIYGLIIKIEKCADFE